MKKMTQLLENNNRVIIIIILSSFLLAPTASDNRTCAACSQCPPGQFITTPCNAKNDTVCSDCPANFICKNGLKAPCPGPTISDPVSAETCACPPGTFGSVGAASFACSACPVGMFCPPTAEPDSTCGC